MPEIKIEVQVGMATVAITADNQPDAIDAAAFFQSLPSQCPVCESPVVFSSRHPKGYDYYGMRCTGNPSHETTFGTHREGGTLFYKEREPWEAYQPANGDMSTAPAAPAPEQPRPAPTSEARPTTSTNLTREEARAELIAAVKALDIPLAAFLDRKNVTDPKKLSISRIVELTEEAIEEAKIPF